jgi:hypothetical protein
MRQSYNLSQEDGSRRSHQCPPSYHKMALTPEYAQASARAPQPSQPSTGPPMLLAPVSPYHQQGSTMPSTAPVAHSSCHLVPFASMGGGSPQMQPHDCLYGLMVPSPRLSAVKTPLVSKLVFYQPARLAAPLDAEALADLKATSQDIAFTISKDRQIPDGWGVVHLARHMDFLTGRLCAIEALSGKLNCEKARRRGGIATFRNRQFRHHPCDQYTDGFGRILDELQDKLGYSALWLLSKLTVPAAAPSHPHQTLGGSSTGSMAPSSATAEAATPSPS